MKTVSRSVLKSSAEGVSLRSWQRFWSNRKRGSNILVLISLVPYRAFGIMASCTQGVVRYGRRWIFFPSPCNLGLAEPCGDIVFSVRDCVKKSNQVVGGGRYENGRIDVETGGFCTSPELRGETGELFWRHLTLWGSSSLGRGLKTKSWNIKTRIAELGVFIHKFAIENDPKP